MESLRIAFYAIIPFLLYMALGAGLNKLKWTDDDFFYKLNSFVFKALFPFLMFKNVYWMERNFVINVPFITFAILSVISVIVLLMIFVPKVIKENPQRGVIVQGIYRSNLALFAIPLSENIYGAKSNLLATMLVAFIIPIYNVCAVIILEYFNKTTTSKLKLLKKIALNPFIISIFTGFIFYFLKIPLIDFIEKPVKICASMATPLAFMALGGTLKLSAVKNNIKILSWTVIFKMIILPCFMFAISMLFPFSSMERFILLLIFAPPTAVSSYTMAQNMGADGPLAGQLVVVTTAVSMFTLFLFIFFLSLAGLL